MASGRRRVKLSPWSQSYEAKPNGMSLEKEEQLRSAGNLFQEPDSTLLLSSGCGRHWPDARGIYHNDDANLFVWVNEEDQAGVGLRFIMVYLTRDLVCNWEVK